MPVYWKRKQDSLDSYHHIKNCRHLSGYTAASFQPYISEQMCDFHSTKCQLQIMQLKDVVLLQTTNWFSSFRILIWLQRQQI